MEAIDCSRLRTLTARRLLSALQRDGFILERQKGGQAGDVDFLVEMEQERSFSQLAGPWQDVQELQGREVDVMTDGGMSSYCYDQLYAEASPL